MINIPKSLQKVIDGGDLSALKLRVLLYRNKWNGDINKYVREDIAVDISDMLIKPGTLSMSLDVNEIAKYETNNMTVTLCDIKNRFREGGEAALFQAGYQIYGSGIEIEFYNQNNPEDKTPIFGGIIKDLPTYKPEEYQLDLRILSPLELLGDIEAKNFSAAYSGEVLTLAKHEEGENPFYKTANTGVGGINAVYAGGVKLFEGIDYEVSQINQMSGYALIEIINMDLHDKTFTADYYCWHRDIEVQDIIRGLLDLANWPQDKRDIRNVIWNSLIKNQINIDKPEIGLSYYQECGKYIFNGSSKWFGEYLGEPYYVGTRKNIFPENFKINFDTFFYSDGEDYLWYALGEFSGPVSYTRNNPENFVKNGLVIFFENEVRSGRDKIVLYWRQDNKTVEEINLLSGQLSKGKPHNITIKKIGNNITVQFKNPDVAGAVQTRNINIDLSCENGNEFIMGDQWSFCNYSITSLDNDEIEGACIKYPGIVTAPLHMAVNDIVWGALIGKLSNEDITYKLSFRTCEDCKKWSDWQAVDIGVGASVSAQYIQYKLEVVSDISAGITDFDSIVCEYLSSSLMLPYIDLSGKSVLEVLEDLSLISGYEFGVDRMGIFFFRPRISSSLPVRILDGNHIIKISSVKKNISNLFTKITLNFAEKPLEFYANDGGRPTLVDKYGVLNKEIDKPEIVNYDNPELAQAIGPQLLEVYSALPKTIQITAVLDLGLELGDIINIKRERPLTVNPASSERTKYEKLNTYYIACKVIGLNYNFEKKQITYTLVDVSNKNTEPLYEFNEFKYIMPIDLGVKE